MATALRVSYLRDYKESNTFIILPLYLSQFLPGGRGPHGLAVVGLVDKVKGHDTGCVLQGTIVMGKTRTFRNVLHVNAQRVSYKKST